MRTSLVLVLFLAVVPSSCRTGSVGQPNLLWITSEDNSPYLGCYGDELAKSKK